MLQASPIKYRNLNFPQKELISKTNLGLVQCNFAFLLHSRKFHIDTAIKCCKQNIGKRFFTRKSLFPIYYSKFRHTGLIKEFHIDLIDFAASVLKLLCF